MTERSTLWLLAGADPTGGAGLWRDVATARACAPELLLATIVTAWTRQGDGTPASAQPRTTEHLRADLAQQPQPRAIKVGLCPAALVGDLLPALADAGAPVVLDPVLMASDGGDLGGRAGRLRDVLRDMSVNTWLITPNRLEAAAIADADAADPDLVARLAERLRGPALLVKDGHGGDSERVCDHLWVAGIVHTFTRLRQPGPDPRGTGCALSTAIACSLARGRPQLHAVAAGITWLDAVRAWTHPGSDGRPHLPDVGPPLPA